MKKITMLAAVGFALSVAACSPIAVAVGAASSVGLAAAQEGGVKRAVTDNMIKLKIADRWLKHDFEMWRKLDLTVKEGRVLVTGSVPKPDMRVEAIRIAWQVNGVKQVLNEVMIEEKTDMTVILKDSAITGSVRTKMMFDKYIHSINYSIDTAHGNVYIMGIAQDEAELDRVIEHARNTSMVTNVISYAHMKGDDVNSIKQ